MRNISIGINVKLRLIITFIILSLHFSVRGYESHHDIDGYNIIDLTVDTMPNLKTARTGHVTLCIDGELTVFGGHSDGFLPLNTAEYLHDGVWHTVTLAYPHDQGTAIKLRSGDVFLSGGFREPLGIGQQFYAELYDPKTHTSHGFGCMHKKRAFLNAVEMADGQVMITGNWYADDCIEMFENVFDPFLTNAIGVKPTSFARANPYILKISEDDVIIFSSFGNMGEQVDCSIVDRLKGPAYHEPLLETWHPLNSVETLRSDNHFIGNEDEGIYEWLLPLENVETREVAIARVKGTDNESEYPAFELLTMRQPLPKILDNNLISYNSLVCDRDRGIAYLIGDDNEARIYVFAIHYDSPDSEPLTIYRTGPQSSSGHDTYRSRGKSCLQPV